jgi:hypothetical protein
MSKGSRTRVEGRRPGWGERLGRVTLRPLPTVEPVEGGEEEEDWPEELQQIVRRPMVEMEPIMEEEVEGDQLDQYNEEGARAQEITVKLPRHHMNDSFLHGRQGRKRKKEEFEEEGSEHEKEERGRKENLGGRRRGGGGRRRGGGRRGRQVMEAMGNHGEERMEGRSMENMAKRWAREHISTDRSAVLGDGAS